MVITQSNYKSNKVRKLNWYNKLTKLIKYIDLNKRKPLYSTKNERPMYFWFQNQINNRKTEKYSMINEDIRNSWDAFIKNHQKYLLINITVWNSKLAELKAFINLNKHKPSQSKKKEQVMYSWLMNQIKYRKSEKYNMSNENNRNIWDTFIKDYQEYFISSKGVLNNNVTVEMLNNNVIEEIMNDNLTEKIINDTVTVKMLNDTVTVEMLNDNVIEKIVSDNVIKKMINNNLTQIITNNNLAEKIMNDNLAGEMINNNVTEEMIINNITEEIINNNVIEEIINNNITEEMIINNLAEEIMNNNLTVEIMNNNLTVEIMNNNLTVEIWNNNLTELKIFINLNKRKPSYKIKTEKLLNHWLWYQQENRRTEKEIMVNKVIRTIWDTFVNDCLNIN